MLSTIYRVDDWVIDHVYQPLLNRFPELDPQAAAGLAMGTVVGIRLAISLMMFMVGELDAQAAVANGLAVAVAVICYFLCFQRSTPAGRNPVRIIGIAKLGRVGMLANVVVSLTIYGITFFVSTPSRLLDTLFVLGDLVWTSALYLQACDKPPRNTFRRPASSKAELSPTG